MSFGLLELALHEKAEGEVVEGLIHGLVHENCLLIIDDRFFMYPDTEIRISQVLIINIPTLELHAFLKDVYRLGVPS